VFCKKKSLITMDKKQLVLTALKPKVKAFGFDKNEVESVAATIADNLELTDEASDEEVTEAINKAVDASIPFLQISQKAVTRIVNAQPKPTDKPEDKPKPSDKPEDKPDEMPAYMKAFLDAQKQSMDELKAELTAMKAKETASSRKARLEDVLQNTGAFGKSAIRQFERMSFKDEEAFEAYLTDVKEDIKTLNQERTEAGLSALGNPPSAGGKKGEQETEVISDEAIEKVAALYH